MPHALLVQQRPLNDLGPEVLHSGLILEHNKISVR